MNSKGEFPHFLQNTQMEVIDTNQCIKMDIWHANYSSIGDGYCLKGIKMERIKKKHE